MFFPLKFAYLLLPFFFLLAVIAPKSMGAPAPFVVSQPDAAFVLPNIVFPQDDNVKGVFDYEKLSKDTSQVQNRYEQIDPALDAVRYLREAVFSMTGKELPVVSSDDKSKGIVFMTLKNAPPSIQNDPDVQSALRNDGKDLYNANEAYFIRTEPNRILIVVNKAQGFSHAVVELLESADYEVLGMGPNWTYVPHFQNKPLIFTLQTAGRPGFYIRVLGLTSGQGYGIGTLFKTPLPDPADETVEISYNRWSIGTRIAGSSMPYFPGNSMQEYEQAVAKKRVELNTTDGFLNDPNAPISFDGVKTLVKEDGTVRSVKLDKSVPFVRDLILEDFKKKSEAYFADDKTGEPYVFGVEPEDGVQPIEFMRYPNWYPEYLAKEGIPFGKPYVLNGFRGLNQPNEIWDPTSFSDTTFGFANWLLHEYDKWIDSLPPAERLTHDGQSKKQMVRASQYSYNYHDVPPDFNLDHRIRVMIAGYPKHRGTGKWKNFATQINMAKAFQIMLPEASGDYTIPSFALYRDFDTSGIGGSHLAKSVQQLFREKYDAGIRAISMETDLNFGKLGLEYYLDTKILWNPHLTATELNAFRDRWFQRAFGSGWHEMKEYYDFLAPENYTVNAPNSWAKAILMINAADQKIDPTNEPAAHRRLDDLKQYWYYYYLLASGQATSNSPALREFIWKGQMSYMTSMNMVMNRYFHSENVREIAGKELAAGPAHYTTAETAAWWAKVLDFWKLTPVSEFANAVLSNGQRGREIDANDLVAVQEFQTNEQTPFFYNSASQDNAVFLSVANQTGQKIGFRLLWPFKPDDTSYGEKNLSYGISQWNLETKSWQELEDVTTTSSPSRLTTGKDGKPAQLVEVEFPAPQPGTYQITLGYGGEIAHLSSLAYSPVTEESSSTQGLALGFTFNKILTGLNQAGPAYVYIPKGVRNFDLENWRAGYNLKVMLHTGLPATGLHLTRTIDASKLGTTIIELKPGEDGSIATLEGGAVYFPYLYSVPNLWSMSPATLLVPRQIAESDGLTILK